MKRNLKNIMLLAGLLAILSLVLYGCGGGGSSYGGGGGGTGGTAPGTFSLLSPADGATGAGTTPILTWTATTGATDYRVQVDTSGTFTGTLLINASESATTYSYVVSSGTLTAGTTYHWRVVAENVYGQAIAGPRTFAP
jgi:hypothetical protein